MGVNPHARRNSEEAAAAVILRLAAGPVQGAALPVAQEVVGSKPAQQEVLGDGAPLQGRAHQTGQVSEAGRQTKRACSCTESDPR